ncbi:MAG TPA: hypothetical protein V6D11_25780, partial [Waterburya sp.]
VLRKRGEGICNLRLEGTRALLLETSSVKAACSSSVQPEQPTTADVFREGKVGCSHAFYGIFQ